VAFYTFDSNRVATVHYQHQDWLGTERTRTSSNGAVEGTYTSLPWGDSLTQTTPGGSDQDASHFATLDHDAESNTDHAEFRQYSNTQGRFMSPDPYDGSYDPSNPQSMNRYTYALNNPLSNIDPSGLDLCDAYDESQDFCTVVYGGGDDGGGGGGGGCSASCQMQYEQWAAGQGQQPQFPNIGGSGSGGSGGGAPNNGPSYTHADVCAASALLNKGGPAALDILGTIPGEGNLLKGAQALGGFASVGLSIFGSGGNSIDGALTGAGFGVWAVDTAKVIQASKSAAKAVPVVGNVLSGISAWRDIWGSEGLVQYYNDCMAWKN
jgi:RHS repeat-associated protein